MSNLSKSLLLQQVLLLVFMLFWFVLSINPIDTTLWVIENILMFFGFIFIIESHQNMKLSNLSYSFIFIFSILQTIGAHYTYSLVPWGFEVQNYFELSRNHYDRLVHFCFGLLLAIPVKEYFSEKVIIKAQWLVLFVLVLVFLGLSGFYEVIEWVYSLIRNDENINGFLGEQGDKWDAQKDIALAGLGAFIALSTAAIFHTTQKIVSNTIFKK